MSPSLKSPNPKFSAYTSSLPGSTSLAHTTRTPLRSNAARTSPIPAKNSAALGGCTLSKYLAEYLRK